MTDLHGDIDVAVIGGGPAGLAAATVLKRAGVERVVVFEREAEAGGIPRHCGHPPFGMREFGRILRGPTYAARLVRQARAAGVEIRTLTTVVEARANGALLVAAPDGVRELTARRVIQATGVRETPRSARLISGVRAGGIMNTGALQSLVYLKNRRPFRAPVILGSELVAFSAIMTCRHAGIRPRAMIEPNHRVTARWPSALFARLTGVALHTGTRLAEIHGDATVTGVSVQLPDGQTRRIECDGVVLTGRFTPESALARCGHIAVDPGTGGPLVDQWGRCSDPVYFATGNLLRPVETAGWSWQEGCRTGGWVAADLAGKLPPPAPAAAVICKDPRLKYAMPQRLALTGGDSGMKEMQLRVNEPVRGILALQQNGRNIWSRRIDTRPERRVLVPLSDLIVDGDGGPIEIVVQQ